MCGSVCRQTFSSSVGTEKLTDTDVTCAICLRRSRSRRTSGDFVSTEQGVAVSRSASQIPGMSL